MDKQITDIINRLELEGKAIEKAIAALRELEGTAVSEPAAEPSPSAPTEPVKQNEPLRKGAISEAGRKRISDALKARWAAKKKAEGNGKKRGLRRVA